MHVETGPNGEQIRKHAGQKRTYKAVSKPSVIDYGATPHHCYQDCTEL